MAAFSERLDRALAMSASAHAKQRRKGTDVPYFCHPVHVAMLLQKAGAPEDVVIAGLLHDTLEDTELAPTAIDEAFGARVRALVDAVTQPAPDVDGRTWREVREAALRHLEAEGPEVVMLKCADTLHNTASLLVDVQHRGADAFARFKRNPHDQLWYYGEVGRLAGERLGPEHPLAAELKATVDTLRRRLGELGL